MLNEIESNNTVPTEYYATQALIYSTYRCLGSYVHYQRESNLLWVISDVVIVPPPPQKKKLFIFRLFYDSILQLFFEILSSE